MELGVPVVVALNMVDVAEAQGLRIDGAALAESIGMPVVPIQANKGRGLDNLKRAIGAAAETGVPVCRPVFPDAFEREVAVLGGALGSDVPDYLVRRLLLDVGGYTEKRLQGPEDGTTGGLITAARQRLAAAGCPVP